MHGGMELAFAWMLGWGTEESVLSSETGDAGLEITVLVDFRCPITASSRVNKGEFTKWIGNLSHPHAG